MNPEKPTSKSKPSHYRKYETEENTRFKAVLDRVVKNHKRTYISLEDYHWFKDARNFRRQSPPRREDLIQFAGRERLELLERNQLLLAAGWRPELIYPSDEVEKEQLISIGRRIVDTIPLPAYVITQEYNIHHWNRLAPPIFGMTQEQADSVPSKMRNIFTFIFDDKNLPLRRILERNKSGWKYTAELNTFWFKLDNILSQYDKWYRELEEWLLGLNMPDFLDVWNNTKVETANKHYYEYVTEIPVSKQFSIKIRGLRIRYTEYEFPRIMAFVPGDEQSRRTFSLLGIATL